MKVHIKRKADFGEPQVIECDYWQFVDGLFTAFKGGVPTVVITDLTVAQTVE